MRRVVFLVTVTVLLAPAHPAAPPLGQRLRVLATDVTPTRWVVGDLVAQDGDSLQLRVAGQPQPVSIARSSLKRLEVGRGQKRAVLEGTGIGFGLGAMVGVLTQLGKVPSHACDGWPITLCPLGAEVYVVRAGLIGGAVGRPPGAALGYNATTQPWAGLPLGPPPMRVAPDAARVPLPLAP